MILLPQTEQNFFFFRENLLVFLIPMGKCAIGGKSDSIPSNENKIKIICCLFYGSVVIVQTSSNNTSIVTQYKYKTITKNRNNKNIQMYSPKHYP